MHLTEAYGDLLLNCNTHRILSEPVLKPWWYLVRISNGTGAQVVDLEIAICRIRKTAELDGGLHCQTRNTAGVAK